MAFPMLKYCYRCMCVCMWAIYEMLEGKRSKGDELDSCASLFGICGAKSNAVRSVWDSFTSASCRSDSRSRLVVLLPQVEQVCPTGSQIDDLGAPIAVLFQGDTFCAVVGIRHSLTAADDALASIGPEVAFFTDTNERRGPDIRVADGAFAVALFAEAANGDARQLAAKDEVRVMSGRVNGGSEQNTGQRTAVRPLRRDERYSLGHGSPSDPTTMSVRIVGDGWRKK